MLRKNDQYDRVSLLQLLLSYSPEK